MRKSNGFRGVGCWFSHKLRWINSLCISLPLVTLDLLVHIYSHQHQGLQNYTDQDDQELVVLVLHKRC